MPSALAAARACGAQAGVTRLAELTKLDALDLPVFQAVRPWSRALCVHQGKGLDRGQAQVSALMEAVESDAAERFDGERLTARADALPAAERADLDDFARRRGGLARDAAVEWTPLARWRDGGRLWAPWLCVSLDLTRDADSPLERASNGQAAHFDAEAARLAGLCELLERDAVGAWLARPPHRRALDRLDLASAQAPWLDALAERARARNIALSLFGFRALVGWPVGLCLMEEPAALNLRRTRIWGSACRPDGLDALEAAVGEAAQSRLTAISAVRDDILPDGPGYPPRAPPLGFGFAPPLPPGLAEGDVRRFHEGDAGAPADVRAAAHALERMGYGPVAEAVLPAPAPAVAIKVFAPGLGMGERSRRAGG